MVPRHGWHQLHMVDGRSILDAVAYKVPEAFTTEIVDIMQVYVVSVVLLGCFASHFVMVKWTIHIVKT
ncbi:hypothetical protein DPMN_134806 [Dreissena polymorpha]|uniref:Uncharacterized protein n=1 Tax=Dreissena polymorpha TaxID=45954 RepID=A0A9D4G0D9_DREPO|nr:hypothetical protein DPMN_134806 [Dreissena polymorpha]